VARVVAFIPDLLFGSQVQGALRAGGHDVELVADEQGMRDRLADVDVLVVDLTDDADRRASLVKALRDEGALETVRTLAFYSHVEADTRSLAEVSGFDAVVPRSRMAREAPALITRALDEARP
jgi:nucleoside-diphosphate-sugar epimerase